MAQKGRVYAADAVQVHEGWNGGSGSWPTTASPAKSWQ
jgi:hypothetical protein